MNNKNNIFRLLRIARDMKVKDLAEVLRVTPAYINAIENGVKIPSSRLIKDYAEIMKVDEDIIIKYMSDSNTDKFEKLLLNLLKFMLKDDGQE